MQKLAHELLVCIEEIYRLKTLKNDRKNHLEQYQPMFGKPSVCMDGSTTVAKGLISKQIK